MPTRLTASWHLPQGEFVYFRGDVESLLTLSTALHDGREQQRDAIGGEADHERRRSPAR